MESLYVISAVGQDRPGLVHSVTRVLADLHINIVDIEARSVRGHFTMFLVVDLSTSSKAVDKLYAVAGDTVVYDLSLNNTGRLPAQGVTLVDPLPPQTAYVPGSLTCSSGVCTYQDGTLTWAGEIAPGDTIMLTIAATLSTPLPDQTVVTNTAYLDDGYGRQVHVPCGPTTVEHTSWGTIKGLYR